MLGYCATLLCFGWRAVVCSCVKQQYYCYSYMTMACYNFKQYILISLFNAVKGFHSVMKLFDAIVEYVYSTLMKTRELVKFKEQATNSYLIIDTYFSYRIF